MEAARRVERATEPQGPDGKPRAEDTLLHSQPPGKWAEMLEKLSPDSFKFKM